MNTIDPTTPQAIIYPLSDFHTHAGLPLPSFEVLTAEALPAPYQELLVHTHGMAPTLQAYHKSKLHLEILKHDHRGGFYLREVILRLDHDEQPVEFCANKIFLGRFPEEAEELILAEQIPLGNILKDCGIKHHTEAKAWFRLEPDAFIAEALELENPVPLYGRKSIVSDSQGRPLSEIVEILPPMTPK